MFFLFLLIRRKINKVYKYSFFYYIFDKGRNNICYKINLCKVICKNSGGNNKYIGYNVLKVNCNKCYDWKLNIKNFFCNIVSVV